MDRKKVNSWDLLWSGLKLNFIQASWNFERLQNVGFLFSIYNILKKIYKDDDEKMNAAVKRHISFFNTHIFFSSAVLGVIAKLEEELPNTDMTAKDREIENTKMGIMGPLAAIGDSLFWSGIKPFALLVGAGIVMIGGYKDLNAWGWAVFITIFIYNGPRVLIKYYLLFKAYFDYKELFVMIQKVKFQDIMKSIKIIGLGMLGVLMAAFFRLKPLDFISSRFLDNLLLILVFGISVAVLKRKVSIARIFISVVIISVLISYLIG